MSAIVLLSVCNKLQQNIPLAVQCSRRLMGHGKRRRRCNRRRVDDETAAFENYLSTVQPSLKQPNWQEVLGWKPIIFLGVAPLIAWGVLCLARPTLREQMFASMKWDTTSSKTNKGALKSTDPVAADNSKG